MEPVEVETTLDAKMWFELKGDAFPEFIYADLCITPPWESSTYQSTTTVAGNFCQIPYLNSHHIN